MVKFTTCVCYYVYELLKLCKYYCILYDCICSCPRFSANNTISVLDLSGRVLCYDRLLLILCVTISVTFADYNDV